MMIPAIPGRDLSAGRIHLPHDPLPPALSKLPGYCVNEVGQKRCASSLPVGAGTLVGIPPPTDRLKPFVACEVPVHRHVPVHHGDFLCCIRQRHERTLKLIWSCTQRVRANSTNFGHDFMSQPRIRSVKKRPSIQNLRARVYHRTPSSAREFRSGRSIPAVCKRSSINYNEAKCLSGGAAP
jgi:hypothetical protein